MFTEVSQSKKITDNRMTVDKYSVKKDAFTTFMDKMNLAEKSVQGNGYYLEEDVEDELDKI
ncbi:hypothetical protein D7V90_14210 [bacterium 1xD42-87]|jgi:hypothetical protein|nr:hypothetical protein D7V90_14210 [bacterium 1xD42-87]